MNDGMIVAQPEASDISGIVRDAQITLETMFETLDYLVEGKVASQVSSSTVPDTLTGQVFQLHQRISEAAAFVTILRDRLGTTV